MYTTTREGSEFVAVVRVNCLSDASYSGLAQTSRRDAEQAAAKEVLAAFTEERAHMALERAKRRRINACSTGLAIVAAKIKAGAASIEAASFEDKAGLDDKNRLHDACARILGRAPQAGDIVYEVVSGNSGPTATARLPCLPGRLGQQCWASPVSRSRRDARAEAARLAVRALDEETEK